MADARGLAEHLEHVVIAESMERVATVVTGHRDGHAPRRELVQQRDAAPARGVLGDPALQIEIAHRQAHHADPGLRGEIEGLAHDLRRLDGEAAAVTADDPASEAPPEDGAGDVR